MKNKPVMIWVVVLACLPFMAGAMELTPEQMATVQLESSTVTHQNTAERFQVSGMLRADQQRVHLVAPLVESVVTRLGAVQNSQVKQGELLAYLHSNSLGIAQAEYLESLAHYQLAEAELTRLKALHKDGVISQGRLLESESKFKTASVMRDQRYRALTLIGLDDEQIGEFSSHPTDLADLLLHSPVSGILLEVNVENGQMLQPGEAAFRIADLSVLWAEVRIPVSRLGSVAMESEAILTVAAYPDQIFTGTLESLGGEVDSASQTIKGRVVIENQQQLLKPGMYVQAQLQGATAKGVMVPRSAVFRKGNASYVFIVTGERTFTPVEVQTGLGSAELVLITKGLESGTKVVTKGVAELKGHWLYQGEE